MTNATRKIHIFDVCGTLFFEDTTAGLVRWHCRRRGYYIWSLLLYCAFDESSPLHLVVKALERITGRHLAKRLLFRVLKNEATSEVRESSQEYVEHLLTQKRLSTLFNILEAANQKGEQIILASASVNPIIEELAERLRLPFVSSRLETRNGFYTGVLARDLSGNKVESLKEQFGSNVFSEYCCGYSDNLSDRELLALCREKTVILHRPAHRKRWDLPEALYVEAWNERVQ